MGKRCQGGKDLGGVEVSEWWNSTPDRGCLWDGGRLQDDLEFRKLRGRLWELKISRGKLLVVSTRVIILMRVKFWSLHLFFLRALLMPQYFQSTIFVCKFFKILLLILNFQLTKIRICLRFSLTIYFLFFCYVSSKISKFLGNSVFSSIFISCYFLLTSWTFSICQYLPYIQQGSFCYLLGTYTWGMFGFMEVRGKWEVGKLISHFLYLFWTEMGNGKTLSSFPFYTFLLHYHFSTSRCYN